MSEIETNTTETTEEVVDTNEYITVNEESFKTESVSTGTNSISFKLSGMTVADAVKKFSSATELSVSGADLKAYGIYQNLVFTSATVDAEGIVMVVFYITSAEEVRISKLEQTQAEQDEVIAELMGGEA